MSYILSTFHNKVCTITLNRADKFNSFNREMALQLQQALDAADADEEVRAIVITGLGKAFCAGQDLSVQLTQQGLALQK